tara:strand:- start:144 stop:509 length:366 start_codon:yes stop_codon:yes gene_type:complete
MTTDKIEQLSNTIKLISNLANFYKKIDFELKHKLIGSIFNENFIFDGKKYRTNKNNKLVEPTFLKVNELKKLKIKKVGKNTHLSYYAPPTGLISSHLLNDLHDFHLLYKEMQAYQKYPSWN